LEEKAPLLVSACLLGVRSRYDGTHARCDGLVAFAPSTHIIPFCPEQLGGLPTPRAAASMKGGDGLGVLAGAARVINKLGQDVTEPFKKGAEEAVSLAQLLGVKLAIVKDGSPSCGLHTPYCETDSGVGVGVTACLFQSLQIRVFELGKDEAFPSPGFQDVFAEIYG
jgi:uncharacterized protein YbbK (DUF523 family)